MPTITITVDETDHSFAATASMVAGLGAARARVMSALQPGEGQSQDTPAAERPGYVANDVEWLEGVVSAHCDRTSEAPDAVLERCLRSWDEAPETAPAVTEPELCPEAVKARLVAHTKASAQQRIITVTGAPDLQLCIVKQLNALMRATELTRNEAATGLNTAEQAEATALQGLADTIKAIRAASDSIEAEIEAGTITTTSQIDAADWA